MLRDAIFLASLVFGAFAGYVLAECSFLAPYRAWIWKEYGTAVLTFSAVLFFNLTAGAYVLARKLSLKDTGQKLAHLERQLRGRGTISEELSRRIKESGGAQ